MALAKTILVSFSKLPGGSSSLILPFVCIDTHEFMFEISSQALLMKSAATGSESVQNKNIGDELKV